MAVCTRQPPPRSPRKGAPKAESRDGNQRNDQPHGVYATVFEAIILSPTRCVIRKKRGL